MNQVQYYPWIQIPSRNLTAAETEYIKVFKNQDVLYRSMSNFYVALEKIAREVVFVPHGHYFLPTYNVQTLQRQLLFQESLKEYTYNATVSKLEWLLKKICESLRSR